MSIISIIGTFFNGSLNNTFGEKQTLNTLIHTYPNPVNSEDEVISKIIIRNDGNNTIHINDIEAGFPQWDNKTNSHLLQNKNLAPAKSLITEIPFNVSSNLSTGKYFLDMLINTSEGHYIESSEIDVKGFDSISLGENISMSLFLIILSGIVTYLIISLLTFKKIESNYIQIGIVGFVLGLINWLILRLINPVFPLNIIHKDPDAIFLIFIYSIIIGLAISLTITIIIYIKNLIKHMKEEKKKEHIIQTQMKRKGYRITGNTFKEFLLSEADNMVQHLGKKYAFGVRVHMSEKINGINIIEGIMAHVEEEKNPHDVVIYPKYTYSLIKSTQIIKVFKEHELLINAFKEDNNYKKNIFLYLRKRNKDKNTHISKHFKSKTIQNKELSCSIINLLEENKDNYNEFIEILEKIDFSKYVQNIGYTLTCSYKYKYKEPIFIQGENILSIEIVRYEPWHDISIQIGNKNIVLPKTFNVIDTPVMEDLTAD